MQEGVGDGVVWTEVVKELIPAAVWGRGLGCPCEAEAVQGWSTGGGGPEALPSGVGVELGTWTPDY